MSRRRKHGGGLPLRIEARTWRDGKTVTYRYIAPTGEKVYLGTNLEKALAAYRLLTHRHPGNAEVTTANVVAALDRQRRSQGIVGARSRKREQFFARAVINADSQIGNENGNLTPG